MEEHNKNINRRDFLKIVGISAATTTAAATLYSCKQKDGVIPGGSASTPVPTDKMTYRTSVAQKRPCFTSGLWLYALADCSFTGWERRYN